MTKAINLPEYPAGVLSVYLNVDQSTAEGERYVAKLRAVLRDLEARAATGDEQRALVEEAARVKFFVETEYVPRGRGLAVFVASGAGIFIVIELPVRVATQAVWDTSAFVRPLVRILDDYEPYGVIAVDRDGARAFRIFFHQIEELPSLQQPSVVRQLRLRSVAPAQAGENPEQVEERLALHQRQTSEYVQLLAQEYRLNRLILIGPQESVYGVCQFLPRPLAAKVIGTAHLLYPIREATEYDVLTVSRPIAEQAERAGELKLVEEVITAAHKHQRAVLGLAPVLEAAWEGRVHRLVVTDSSRIPGSLCQSCGYHRTEGVVLMCPRCKQPMQVVEDAVEYLVDRVLRDDGYVEFVHGLAAERLLASAREGVAAVLRY